MDARDHIRQGPQEGLTPSSHLGKTAMLDHRQGHCHSELILRATLTHQEK